MTYRVLTAVPVYNEQKYLEGVLSEVRKHSQDVLAVDDGSKDATPEILARLAAAPAGELGRLSVATHVQNRGYGAALLTAFEHAIDGGYDVLVTIDCDGQHQPKRIPELARAAMGDLIEGLSAASCHFTKKGPGWRDDYAGADIVSGSRYLVDLPEDDDAPAARRRINETITAELNQRLGLRLTDAFCGFKAYRTGALKKLSISEWGYAMPLEFWVKAVAAELSVVEAPVPRIYLDENRSFGGALDDSDVRLQYYRLVMERTIDATRLPRPDVLARDCGRR
jgi:dolichol-phosphate mannosyltransferase